MYTTGGNVGIRLDGLHGSYLKHMEINAKHHQSKLFIILRIFKTSQLKRVAQGETSMVFESTHIYNSFQIQNHTQVRSAHSDPTYIQYGKSCELSVICMQQIMWLLKASCHAILRATLCLLGLSISLWMQYMFLRVLGLSFKPTVLFNHMYLFLSECIFLQVLCLSLKPTVLFNHIIMCLFLSECSTTVLFNYACLFLSECSTVVLFNYACLFPSECSTTTLFSYACLFLSECSTTAL